MAKRGNSEGTITKRTDGRWMARITLPDGKWKAYYGRTRQEAAQKLVRAQKHIADGLPLAGERQRTDAFLGAWLLNSAAQRVRPQGRWSATRRLCVSISPRRSGTSL